MERWLLEQSHRFEFDSGAETEIHVELALRNLLIFME